MYLDDIDHKCLITWPISCVFIRRSHPPADSSRQTSKCLAEQMAPSLWPDSETRKQKTVLISTDLPLPPKRHFL